MVKTNILVVEDEVIIARDIQRTLIRLGYEVPTYSDSGEAALEQVASNRPDLVLMDIHLRGPMDGIGVADEIRRRYGLPVVYLTAHSDEATLQRAKITEPYGYVLKPFDERELQIAIEIALYRHMLERQVDERTRDLDEARQQAERINALKTRFLTAASHDLRQPLQSASLYLSVLSQHLATSKYSPICEDMRESLTAMEDILNALLDISRLESGNIRPNKKDFSLRDLFERLMTNTIQQAEAKRLNIEYQKNDCVVHSDPALLERIIENFITNAIRYTEQGRILIAYECENGAVRISVEDTGLGIPPNELAHIFDDYYQVSNPERNRQKGLGLGLAIVKHIANILDHPLDVRSVLGQGSVFTIRVPLGQAPRSEASIQGFISTSGSSRNRSPLVLFIDDDPSICKAMKMLFDTNGIEACFARSGAEALAKVQAGIRPNIVISDYQLPGYNGVETLQRIRNAADCGFSAIVITGDTAAQQALAQKPGDYSVFHKPVDPQRLLAMIADAAALTPIPPTE